MIDKDKNYWLYIVPHVYCRITDVQALLYNTQTGESMETCVPDIIALLRSLHEKKNLGAVYCEGKRLTQEPYLEFIIEFCQKGMGNLYDVIQIPEKPIQLMPVLSLQRDIDKLQKEYNLNTGESVLQYLLELNLYLHTDCPQQCPFCNYYSRQGLCCLKENKESQKSLDISIFKNILSQIRYGAVGKLNLLGGNLSECPYYNELPVLLTNFKGHVHIWNHYANFSDRQAIFPEFYYDVPVIFPVDENILEYCITLLKDTKTRYHFFITGTEEYEKTKILVKQYRISNYVVRPIYTKNNQTFFEEYIYTNREDIFQTKLSFRQIYAHQKLNTYFFGSLTVLSGGKVYANVNSPVLGDIKTDTLLILIHKEMIVNTAWRKIRESIPCSCCLYQYLCPSPSNYEFAMDKPNLCHIKK